MSEPVRVPTAPDVMLMLERVADDFPVDVNARVIDVGHHFGCLSPLHVDRVDLSVFPLFAHTQNGVVAHVKKGDVVLIPDGWWHQVRSAAGRNSAITFEIEPHEGLQQLWADSYAWTQYQDDSVRHIRYIRYIR